LDDALMAEVLVPDGELPCGRRAHLIDRAAASPKRAEKNYRESVRR
jgi:hypothetical protein